MLRANALYQGAAGQLQPGPAAATAGLGGSSLSGLWGQHETPPPEVLHSLDEIRGQIAWDCPILQGFP